MKTSIPRDIAQIDLNELARNPYPGRGICMGVAPDGSIVQIYWIMGRSNNSRNRVFVSDKNGLLKTVPANLSEVEDSSLILYNAMAEYHNYYIVTNGEQTDAMIDELLVRANPNFYKALNRLCYEPDAPNFTPRITGIHRIKKPGEVETILSIVKKSPFDDSSLLKVFSFNNIPKGVGYCITTYQGDGNPLPSFKGSPYLLPIYETPKDTAEHLWDHLDEANRISIAVKFIEPKSGASNIYVKNKYVRTL